MKLKMWGTRGSIPRAMSHSALLELVNHLLESAKTKGISTLEDFSNALNSKKLGHPLTFGGNTPCVEVFSKNDSAIVDMGSGLRDVGTLYAGRKSEFTFFMTHLHLDHLLGLPFFVPVFMKGTKIKIYHVHKTAPKVIKNLFDGVTFPLTWKEIDADFEFIQIKPYQNVNLGELSVTPFCLDHPGGSFGYRFEAENKSLVIGFDGEFKRFNRRDLGSDLPFYQNLDLIVFDAQYELEELVKRFDWGHCSAPIGVDLAIREGIRKLIMFHHDPWATEDKLANYFYKAKSYVKSAMRISNTEWPHKDLKDGPEIEIGYDGLEVEI